MFDAKYVRHFAAGRKKSRQTKCVMYVVEWISMVEGIYKGRERWDFECAKLLREKVGDKCFCKFGGINTNAEMYWKKIYNNMVLAKAFETTRNGTVL